MKSKSNNSLTYLLLIGAMLFWGLSYIWYKQVLDFIKPITLILSRLVISSVVMAVYLKVFKKIQPITKQNLKYFLLLALFEPFFYFICETYGLLYISSSLASIIISTIPLFTPFSAYIFFKEKLSVNNYFGLFISFVGVLTVILSDMQDYDFSIKGVILVFLAVLSTQGYIVILRKLSNDYSATVIVSYQNMIGAIYFIPLFLIFEKDYFNFQNILLCWKPLLGMSVLASSLAFMFFTKGVKELGMARANVFSNFIPVFTLIFGVILLGESVSYIKMVGVCITIWGLVMTQSVKFPRLKAYSRVK
ncbi:MAG: DMT family transporter [Bacteroidales bacterium]|nr:DMT family transporter [Bacteroidales bacterium]